MAVNTLYVCFKTKVTEELNFKKLGRDKYIEQTTPTAMAFAVNGDEPVCELFPFGEEIHEAARACAAGGPEDWFVVGHYVDFHAAIWRKMGWPEPWKWGCTMTAAKRKLTSIKSHALDSLVDHLALPQRLKIDEMGIMGGYTEAELRAAAIRDVCLCRAVFETILNGQPQSVIL